MRLQTLTRGRAAGMRGPSTALGVDQPVVHLDKIGPRYLKYGTTKRRGVMV